MRIALRECRGWWRKSVLVLGAAIAFVAAAHAQTLKVTLLGTGNPRPVMERFGPSILVEAGQEKMLFDCGRGATQRIYQLKVNALCRAATTIKQHLFLPGFHQDTWTEPFHDWTRVTCAQKGYLESLRVCRRDKSNCRA